MIHSKRSLLSLSCCLYVCEFSFRKDKILTRGFQFYSTKTSLNKEFIQKWTSPNLQDVALRILVRGLRQGLPQNARKTWYHILLENWVTQELDVKLKIKANEVMIIISKRHFLQLFFHNAASFGLFATLSSKLKHFRKKRSKENFPFSIFSLASRRV